MRLYHFANAEHALEDIRCRRLKIATFGDLNDPFELLGVAQPRPGLRRWLRRWKAEMTCKHGLLCFSANWRNPLLWSHYADRHCGIALGFDLKDDAVNSVTYVKQRPILEAIDESAAQKLLYTKYKDWKYEDEHRVYTDLKDKDATTGLYFAEFSDGLMLREVIAGPACSASESKILEAVRDGATAKLLRARLAFNSFSVVEDRRGFGKREPRARRAR